MKIKFIAAACLALCSSASFAAGKTVVVCNTASPLLMAQTCAPEATLFIGGSSALGAALNTVALDLFETPAAVATIKSSTGLNGGKDQGWYGMSKADVTGGVSKRLYVVYNSQNGSAAGVSQLLAKFDPKATGVTVKNPNFIVESQVVSVGPTLIATGAVPGTCDFTDHVGTNTTALTCATPAVTQADVAISDVAPQELYALYPAATAKLTTVTSVPLALQGFGVAVSAKLYAALQADQGLSSTEQPSVRRADYASLVTGSAKTVAVLFNKDTTPVLPLNLARRDALSGTQASSNIFFANNACGNNHLPFKAPATVGKVIVGVLGGQLSIIGAEANTTDLTVTLNATGGGVVTELNKDAYGIGIISLNSPAKGTESWKFVKLDGVSPNADVDGKSRVAMAAGDYPFAMTAFAVTTVKQNPLKTGLIEAVVSGLQSSTAHNFAGIAYLDGGTDYQSKVARTNGNNCSPLIKGL